VVRTWSVEPRSGKGEEEAQKDETLRPPTKNFRLQKSQYLSESFNTADITVSLKDALIKSSNEISHGFF